MASQDRKYAALPDLVRRLWILSPCRTKRLTLVKDEAPDIYETPDLTDDTSTLQTSTAARSPSPTASEISDADPNSGISRHRLQPTAARTQFRSSRIDAREADFSDRVNSKRRAYRITNRRGRTGALVEGNAEGGEDWSEDEEEGLDRRLARLLREAQEVQAELDKRTEGTETIEVQNVEDRREGGGLDVTRKFRELNAALEKIRTSQLDAGSAHAKLAKELDRQMPEQTTPAIAPDTKDRSNGTSTSDHTEASALSKVADFDTRLAFLERALGLSVLDTPDAASNGSTSFAPVLPTLTLLDRQVNLLSSVPSQPHLDSVIQKLHQAQVDRQASQSNGDGNGTVTPSTLSAEDMAKLRALYAVLPQLTSMAPTLPPLLARLRSLRTLHANAAAASQTLDEVERRQDEADKEIKEWTAGLAKVAEAVKSAEGGMRENVGALDKWVKDLEERITKLG